MIVLEPGTIVADRYRLDRMLGQGGMGVVWAATHAITRRTVAMKFIRSALQQQTELRQRLLREAHAAAAVQHPNVVEILDVFELDADMPVIVMSLLQGETLGQRLSREPPLSLAEAAGILVPAISAIGTAHARGVIHRDLKPDNIFLAEGPEGTTVKVLDFGIAKLQTNTQAPLGSMSTQTGSTLGTPSYMAPEQAAGEKDVDHRADIWALGVIAYECLSGMRPIEGENAAQVIMRLMTSGITPLSRVTRGLPREITTLVDGMLAREPVRRCEDLREARRILARYTTIHAREFGAPGSELSTDFERDSRRSSDPVAFSVRTPSSDTPATIVDGSPRHDSSRRTPTPVRSHAGPSSAFKRLGILAGLSVVGLLAWRLVGTPSRSDPVDLRTPKVEAASIGVATASATSASSGRPPEPPTPTHDAAPTSTVKSTTRESSPRSAPASGKGATPTAPIRPPAPAASASASASPPIPEAAASPPPAPSSSARGELKTPRRPGLVDEVPF